MQSAWGGDTAQCSSEKILRQRDGFLTDKGRVTVRHPACAELSNEQKTLRTATMKNRALITLIQVERSLVCWGFQAAKYINHSGPDKLDISAELSTSAQVESLRTDWLVTVEYHFRADPV